jgi:tRNA(fMet)-specific endonuclease VapC
LAWSGRSQAMRLPKQYRFDAEEVRIRRQGNAVILEPIAKDWAWSVRDNRFARLRFRRSRDRRAWRAETSGPGSVQVRFLFDTNAVMIMLNCNHAFNERVRSYRPDEFGLSAIVAHELYFGAFRSRRRTENLDRVDRLQFEVIDFSRDDARLAGSLRADLAATGTPIGPYDVLIAARALSRGRIILTHNNPEFARVAGLLVEDWQA